MQLALAAWWVFFYLGDGLPISGWITQIAKCGSDILKSHSVAINMVQCCYNILHPALLIPHKISHFHEVNEHGSHLYWLKCGEHFRTLLKLLDILKHKGFPQCILAAGQFIQEYALGGISDADGTPHFTIHEDKSVYGGHVLSGNVKTEMTTFEYYQTMGRGLDYTTSDINIRFCLKDVDDEEDSQVQDNQSDVASDNESDEAMEVKSDEAMELKTDETREVETDEAMEVESDEALAKAPSDVYDRALTAPVPKPSSKYTSKLELDIRGPHGYKIATCLPTKILYRPGVVPPLITPEVANPPIVAYPPLMAQLKELNDLSVTKYPVDTLDEMNRIIREYNLPPMRVDNLQGTY